MENRASCNLQNSHQMVVITKKSVLIKANKLKHWPTAYQKKKLSKNEGEK